MKPPVISSSRRIASMREILADTGLQSELSTVARKVACNVVERESVNLFSTDPRFSYNFAALDRRADQAMKRIKDTPICFATRNPRFLFATDIYAIYRPIDQVIAINCDHPDFHFKGANPIDNILPDVIHSGVHELLHAAEPRLPDKQQSFLPVSWLDYRVRFHVEIIRRSDPKLSEQYNDLLRHPMVQECCQRLGINIHEEAALEKMLSVQFASWSEYIIEYLAIEGLNLAHEQHELEEWMSAEDLPHLSYGATTSDHVRKSDEDMLGYDAIIHIVHAILDRIFQRDPKIKPRYDAFVNMMRSGIFLGRYEGERKPWTVQSAILAEQAQARQKVKTDDPDISDNLEGIMVEKLMNTLQIFGFKPFVVILSALPVCKDVVNH